MFSHYYYYYFFFFSNSNFTKKKRICEHIWTYFVYNHIRLYMFIYMYSFFI